MDNKKMDVFFYLIIIVSILSFFLLMKDFEIKRSNDLKAYSSAINGVVKGKDSVIKTLYSELVQKEKENENLRVILSDTRNDLEGLTKKLVQPAPAAAPASVPTPANASAPVAATK